MDLTLPLPQMVEDQPVQPGPAGSRRRPQAGARAAYCLLAALAAALVVWTLAQGGQLGIVHTVNQITSGSMLAVLSMAACLSLHRFAFVRYACIAVALWAMFSPLVLPGEFPPAAVAIGLVTVLAAGCAADG